MKALVTGANGMLGQDLVSELTTRGWDVIATDIGDIDITDPMQVARIARGKEFGIGGWLFNCAAYTNVDGAESDRDSATLLNSIAPGYLAQACLLCEKRMIHVSTDFVFDGKAHEPYLETDRPNPTGVYGRTKLEGEDAVLANNPSALVVRTAWLYGPLGKCFPKTMIQAFDSGKELKVVADQRGNPTYTVDLARVIVDLAERNVDGGIYHAAGPETITWHEFAERTLTVWKDEPVKIEAIRSKDWPTPTKRPAFSALSFEKCAQMGIKSMRPVDEALRDFCQRLR